jgi:hypothetical protein
VALGAILLAGCGGSPEGQSDGSPAGGRSKAIRISAADLPPGRWPLTVNQGELRCEGKAEVIFSGPGLRDYGVSAAAVKRGLPTLDRIWKRKPGPRRVLVDITPLLDRGLALCR